VVFTYHKSEIEADLLRQETGATPVRCDVKHQDSVKIAVDKAVSVLGQIDVLICSAAIAGQGLISDMDISKWEEVINTDLSGVFYCIRYILPAMISRRSGCIITVGPMCEETGASAYSAAKAGVIGLTKALAEETRLSGIRVNCISAGNPAGAVRTMLFIASDDASSVTGQVIGVSGDPVI
jgi:3-oxoacyl-[acyl-carrier protein] reductase